MSSTAEGPAESPAPPPRWKLPFKTPKIRDAAVAVGGMIGRVGFDLDCG